MEIHKFEERHQLYLLIDVIIMESSLMWSMPLLFQVETWCFWYFKGLPITYEVVVHLSFFKPLKTNYSYGTLLQGTNKIWWKVRYIIIHKAISLMNPAESLYYSTPEWNQIHKAKEIFWKWFLHGASSLWRQYEILHAI